MNRLGVLLAVAAIIPSGVTLRVAHAPARSIDVCVLPGERPESLNVTSPLDRKREADALSRTRGRARRAGDTLVLQMADGSSQTFVDCTQSWDRYVRYVFEALGPRGQGFVVWVSAGEPTNFFWLDTARDTLHILHSLPHYFSDSSRFVIANSDLEAEFTRNALELWRISGASLTREFGIVGGPYGFEFEAISGDTLVRLFITRMRPSIDSDSLAAVLVRRPTGWSLHLRER